MVVSNVNKYLNNSIYYRQFKKQVLDLIKK